MDLHCSTCGEPWDVYHLRHDAIFETDLDPAESEAWRSLSAKERLSSRYRERLSAAGYQFGGSIFDVMHCPACPKGAKPEAVTLDEAVRLIDERAAKGPAKKGRRPARKKSK